MFRVVLFGAIVGVAGGAALHAQPPGAQSLASVSPRTNYLERCGGCHGVEGRSTSMLVPDLKGRAGYFLCSDLGRNYAARLPNVVFSEISDNDLAALLNYVMFDLGAGSAPADAMRYAGGELSELRKHPLTTTDLLAYRRRIVSDVIKNCRAPRSLLTDYHPKT
jgi:cytochrome c553